MTLFQRLLANEIVRGLGWTLLHSLWQILAIAVLAALLLANLQRARATVRYVIACAAMVAMFLVVPGTLAYVLVQGTRPPVVTSVDARFDFETASLLSDLPATTAEAGPSDRTAGGSQNWTAACIKHLDDAAPYLAFIWLLGFSISGLRTGAGCMAANQLCCSSIEELPERIRLSIDRLAARIGITRPLQALASARVDVPCIVGWLRPVLLVPISLVCQMSTHQLEALLAHELAHVRRHDYLVNLVESLMESALFYHPAAWWLGRRIREERENCCDDIAVACCNGVADYAGALATLEETRGAMPKLAMAASSGSLLSRIRRLAAPDTIPQLSRIPAIVNALVIIGFLATFGAKWGHAQGLPENAPDEKVGFITYVALDGTPFGSPITPAQRTVAERLKEPIAIADEALPLREVVARLSRMTSMRIICPLDLGLVEIQGLIGAKPLANELATILAASHLGCRVETSGVLRIVPASKLALPMRGLLQFAARLDADALRQNLFGGDAFSVSELVDQLEERIPASINQSDRVELTRLLQAFERLLPSNMVVGSVRVQAERVSATGSAVRFSIELSGMCRVPEGSAADRVHQIENFKRLVEAAPEVMRAFEPSTQIMIRDGAEFPNPLPNVTAFSLVLTPRES